MDLKRLINSTAVTKVSTLKLAKNWATNGRRQHSVLMGDNNKYWVVTSKKLVQQLVKAGYELVSPLDVYNA